MAGLRPLVQRYPKSVVEVRGKGLMVGVEFSDPKLAEEVQWACFTHGLLVLECGKQTVRLCPPLIATAEDIRTAIEIFREAVESVATHPAEMARQAAAAGALHDGEVDG
jgi:4-aminobutyrate aminotransferase